MLEAVNHALEEYKATYRRTGLPDLRPSGLYALFHDEAQTGDVASGWNEEWPYSDDAGVYIIFGGSGRLLYIGKASMTHCIGGRLSAYFGSDMATGKCRIVHDWGSDPPKYVATVAVPKDMKFEAPALEEYLIARVPTAYNLRGVGRHDLASARPAFI